MRKRLLSVLLLPLITSAAWADDAGLRELARMYSSLEAQVRVAQAQALARQYRTAPQSCAEALAAKPPFHDADWNRADLLLNEMVLSIMTANGIAPAKPCPAMINDDDEFQAYSTGSGSIIVYTGMLRRAQDDDELSFVLGHEIAHWTLHHAYYQGIENKMMERARWYYYWHRTTVKSMQLAETRAMEGEADRQGMLYAAKAGYDLSGVGELFADARRLHPPNPRHPAPESRNAALQPFFGVAVSLPHPSHPIRNLDEMRKLIK